MKKSFARRCGNVITSYTNRNMLIHFSKEQTILLKGIAISCVLIGHYFENMFSLSQPLGAIGVYIFLIVSGYGLMLSVGKNGLKNYWNKRFNKVYIPYMLIVVFYLICLYVFRQSMNIDFWMYLTFLKIPVSEYWYLRIQIEWYLVFFVIWKLKDRFSIATNNVFILVFLSDLLIVVANMRDRKYVWTLGAFLLGGGMALYGTKWLIHLRKFSVAIGLIVVSIVSLVCKKLDYVEQNELGFADTVLQWLIIFCVSMFLLIFAQHFIEKNSVFKKLMLKLGKYSYELYLTHTICLCLLRNTFFDIKEKMVATILFIVLTIVLTVVLNRSVSVVLKLPIFTGCKD